MLGGTEILAEGIFTGMYPALIKSRRPNFPVCYVAHICLHERPEGIASAAIREFTKTAKGRVAKRSVRVRRAAQLVLFEHPDDAMLFKLAWNL